MKKVILSQETLRQVERQQVDHLEKIKGGDGVYIAPFCDVTAQDKICQKKCFPPYCMLPS